MRRLISLFLIIIFMLSLTACKEQEAPQDDVTPPPVSTTPEVKDNIDFHEQAEEMSVADATTYLQKEEADETSVQYKEAVYTVNENLASQYIAESKNSKAATEETKQLFEGIYFQFIEEEGFTSQTVKNGLLPLGSYEEAEDGWYRFVFWDRTLAQSSVTQENGHCLSQYTKALEFLLSDPNVIVKPIE